MKTYQILAWNTEKNSDVLTYIISTVDNIIAIVVSDDEFIALNSVRFPVFIYVNQIVIKWIQ